MPPLNQGQHFPPLPNRYLQPAFQPGVGYVPPPPIHIVEVPWNTEVRPALPATGPSHTPFEAHWGNPEDFEVDHDGYWKCIHCDKFANEEHVLTKKHLNNVYYMDGVRARRREHQQMILQQSQQTPQQGPNRCGG